MHAYHSVLHVNGTECDMTKTPRSTEVKVQLGIRGLMQLQGGHHLCNTGLKNTLLTGEKVGGKNSVALGLGPLAFAGNI